MNENKKTIKDNSLLNENSITDCLFDLYFYLLGGDNAENYLKEFGKKYVRLNEDDKEKIREEIKNNLNINKPKSK